jgi:hypothetical protein
MEITTTPIKAFDLLSIDTIGPFVESNHGNKYAVTIQDDLTKLIEIIPIPAKDANTVARAIVGKFILTYGMMACVKTDMGTEYLNEIFREVGKILKIAHVHSTSYHPQTLGAIEVSHRWLTAYLREYICKNKSNWDTWCLYFKFCYNTTPGENSYSPFSLTFGRQANLPMDIVKSPIQPIYNIDNYAKELQYRLKIAYDRANKFLIAAKEKRKLEYDKKLNVITFHAGDRVLVSNEARTKLDQAFFRSI